MLPVSTMIMFMALLCLMEVEGSQYSWHPPPKNPAPMYYRPSLGASGKNLPVTARGYSSAPGFTYYGTASGGYRNNNNVPGTSVSNYYKKLLGDKSSSYVGGVASNAVGNTFGGGGYNSRYTNNMQNPLQNRQAGYTQPASGPGRFSAYGNHERYRPAGFYGAKAPTAHSYPVNIPQAMRGSRVYDGGKGMQHTNNSPTTKNTGVYVIPTPSKLYYDGIKN